MKTHHQTVLVALAVLAGGIALAQSIPYPTKPAPVIGSARGTNPALSPHISTAATTARGPIPEDRQPRMRDALLDLNAARVALLNALPDKGGNREKAIASVDQAIKDVQAGMDYARAHAEEFPATSTTGPHIPAARGPAVASPAATS